MAQHAPTTTKDELVELISCTLLSRRDALKSAFAASADAVGVRYVAVDDLLPEKVALAIEGAFPDSGQMRLMDSFRERKYTFKAYDR